MSPRTIRLFVVTSVLGVFLAGLVVGYAAAVNRSDSQSVARPLMAGDPPRDFGPPGDVEARIARRLERFGSALELTARQRTAITELLLDGERAMREITSGVRPKLQAKRAEIETAISAVLTSEQRVRYRELVPHGLARPPGRPPPPRDQPPSPSR